MSDTPTTDTTTEANQPEPTGPEADQAEPESDGRYPAEVVEGLRREAAERRTRAREAEEALATAQEQNKALSARLLDLTVTAHAGTLADPADLLTYTEAGELLGDDGLPDPEKVTTAAAELVARKPQLARRPLGDIDQGARGTAPEAPFDFAGLLKRAAG